MALFARLTLLSRNAPKWFVLAVISVHVLAGSALEEEG